MSQEFSKAHISKVSFVVVVVVIHFAVVYRYSFIDHAPFFSSFQARWLAYTCHHRIVSGSLWAPTDLAAASLSLLVPSSRTS